MKLSEDLQQCHDCGDFGQGLEGFPEDAKKLEVELDAANVKAFIMQDVLNFFISASNTPDAYKEMARDVLMKTPAQSLHTIQAQAVTDLISEYSYDTYADGIATRVIAEDDAESYADRLKGEG